MPSRSSIGVSFVFVRGEAQFGLPVTDSSVCVWVWGCLSLLEQIQSWGDLSQVRGLPVANSRSDLNKWVFPLGVTRRRQKAKSQKYDWPPHFNLAGIVGIVWVCGAIRRPVEVGVSQGYCRYQAGNFSAVQSSLPQKLSEPAFVIMMQGKKKNETRSSLAKKVGMSQLLRRRRVDCGGRVGRRGRSVVPGRRGNGKKRNVHRTDAASVEENGKGKKTRG